MENKKNLKKGDVASKVFWAVMWVVLIIYCISLIVPVVWVLLSSLKDNMDFMLHPFEFPRKWMWENYATAWNTFEIDRVNQAGQKMLYGIFPMALYSCLNTFGRALISTVSTMLVAYVIGRYKFIGREFLFNLGIIVMIVPIIGSLPSSMQVKKALGTHNNMFLLMICSPVTVFSGLHFLLLHGVFSKIPQDYSDAAFIDGAGHYSVMFKIIMPMAIPTAVAIFVLVFISTWNDYNMFILWMPSYPSIAIGVYMFQANAVHNGATTPIILAVMILACIPTALIWFFMKKIIMEKFTVGGLKG